MQFLRISLAAGAMCVASSVLALDHPYAAPAAVPAPAATARASQYWNRQVAHYDGEAVPEGAPEAAPAETIAPSHEYAPAVDAGCCGDEGGTCYDDAMGSCNYDCCGYSLYGSAAGLIMTRDQGNKVWTTFDNTNQNNQLVNTWDAGADWVGGFEITIGAAFGGRDECGMCCDRCGVEGTYWMLDEMRGSTSIRSDANVLNTTLDVGFVTIDGAAAATFFDNAREHRLERRNQVQNLELNFLYLPMTDEGSFVQLDWLMGVRYFNFEEDLTFSSLRGGVANFGDNGGVDEAHLEVDVENHLIGFQVGTKASVGTQRLKFYALPKVGIYGNHIEADTVLYDGAGNIGLAVPPAPGVAQDLDLHSSQGDVAFMAELDLGAEFWFTPNVGVFAGYRAVAVSGVALSDEQIPNFLVDVPEWEDIDSNGHLIVHGGYGGLEFRW
jgi:hypothetical protein